MSGFPAKLKPFYYLDHFEEMLCFIDRSCPSLLGPGETEFMHAFGRLPRDARALMVRMANRCGCYARISGLRYEELADIPAALSVLQETGLIGRATEADRNGIVGMLTRAELATLLKPTKGLSALKKSELKELILQTGHPVNLPDELLDDFVVQVCAETVGFLFFLYFGKERRNLQALALRDLGLVKTRTGQTSFEVRFTTREAAVHAFFHARISAEIVSADSAGLTRLVETAPNWPKCSEPAAVALSDREICRLGMRLEQSGRWEEALAVYGHAEGHPARERTCRILYSRSETERAKEFLEVIISQPCSDDELLFAEDFHARKFGTRRLSRLTELLRSAPVVEIDEAFSDSSEEALVDYLNRQGERAYRTENHLWNSLFGLLFWDLLQGQHGETKHNEFEHRPTQLTDGTFYLRNESAIEQQLSRLHSPTCWSELEGLAQEHSGKPNGVFRWRRNTLSLIRELLLHGPIRAIEGILRRIAMNPLMYDSGFPDLMVIGKGGLRFVEVKADGDQIRRNQLVQIQALEREGFTVEVVRVKWIADPEQEYVVVDVETTGGRAAYHRVTEIGAVKVKAGQVVDRFSTLVNPEKPIPRNITRLTGITDEMVEDAPRFSEISSRFRDFIGKSVFVAHNATFDYGFIREEFRRLGESFRSPTLCTVVSMRKCYPGLPSYSLARLTQHFGIPLEAHHRALCDAEATAGLLHLINEKRMRGD